MANAVFLIAVPALAQEAILPQSKPKTPENIPQTFAQISQTPQKPTPQKLNEQQINSRIRGTLNSQQQQTTQSEQPADAGNLTDRQPDLAYGAFQRGFYLTAFKYALPRAQLGDPAAQTLIGELYDKGLGIRLDKKESTQWYKFAAKSGSREAQFSYALKLLEGKYVAKDEPAARELLKLAANAGHPVAQFNYAQIVMDERPTSRGIEIALGYYEKAAEMGVADAYYAMAQIHSRGVGTAGPDEKKARELLIKAAKNGFDNAQVELAIWMANGRGGEKDLDGALSWFSIAANRDNVIAQNRLARMLVLGLGTEVKPEEAAKWYVLARRSGHKDAMLDDFFNSLAPDIRKRALDAANRWPSRYLAKN
jgi:TPR repeat protein